MTWKDANWDYSELGSRIEKLLWELSDSGLKGGQIWRAAYTEEDQAAKKLLKRVMEDAGLRTYEDAAGDLFGCADGVKGKGEVCGCTTIMTGSHRDTVRDGGRYDGAVGIITAIEALRELLLRYGPPARTVEAVALIEEEGSRFASGYLGSRAINGQLDNEALRETDKAGITVAEALRQAGGQPDRIETAYRDNLASFLELHVEQGPVLYETGTEIGIVENIVGLYVYEIEIVGKQNHAGTTPMRMRLDPMAEAASVISTLSELPGSVSESAVLTVGRLEASPGMSNVIPSSVKFLVDIRDGLAENMVRLERKLSERLKETERKGFSVTVRRQCHEKPAALDHKLTGTIEAAADLLGITHCRMNSGAGHDAQVFASQVPTAMIFIPSVEGISHSPHEFTSPEDLGKGAAVLAETLRLLAWD